MGKAFMLFLKLMFTNIGEIISETFELLKYITKYLVMILIAWGVSYVLPISIYHAGVLLMMFWFLNLYNRRD